MRQSQTARGAADALLQRENVSVKILSLVPRAANARAGAFQTNAMRSATGTPRARHWAGAREQRGCASV